MKPSLLALLLYFAAPQPAHATLEHLDSGRLDPAKTAPTSRLISRATRARFTGKSLLTRYPNLREFRTTLGAQLQERGMHGWNAELTERERRNALLRALKAPERIGVAPGLSEQDWRKLLELDESWAAQAPPSPPKPLLESLSNGLLQASEGPADSIREWNKRLAHLVEEIESLPSGDTDAKMERVIHAAEFAMNTLYQDGLLHPLASVIVADKLLLRSGLPLPTLGKQYPLPGAETQSAYRKRLFTYFHWAVKETIRNELKKKVVDESHLASNAKAEHYPRGRTLGEGLQGKVQMSAMADGTPAVFKIASNLAALAFNRQEVELADLIQRHFPEYSPYFIRVFDSDPSGHWLVKEFVAGKTGDEILREGPLSDHQKRRLSEYYRMVKEIEDRTGIFFDSKRAHNLIWNETADAWICIDLGPRYDRLPEMSDFDRWFNAFWLKAEDWPPK